MAIGGFDGSITINTTIETGDINAQFDDMSNTLRQSSEKLFTDVGAAAKKSEQVVAASFGNTAEKVKGGLVKAAKAADAQQGLLTASAQKVNTAIASGMRGTEGIVARSLAKITSISTGTFVGIVAGALMLAAIGKAFVDAFKEMGKMPMYAAAVNQLKSSFSALKSQFATLAAPLVALFIPVLQRVVDWLTNVINVAAQVIAKLAGQDTYMVAIAGSSGEYAGNMEDAEKATKGQLAAFDKLNVIGKDAAATSGGGGGSSGGITWKEVPLDPGKTKWIDDIKKAFGNTQEWLDLHFFGPVGTSAIKLWGGIKEGAGLAYVGITTGDWSGFNLWWDTDVMAPVKAYAATAWTDIKAGAGLAWIGITTGDWSGAAKWFEDEVLTPTLRYFNFSWDGAGGVKETINGVLAPVKATWILVSDWFATNVLDPIAGLFGAIWTGEGGIAEQIKNARIATQKDWQGVAQWFETDVFTGIKSGWALVVEAFTGGLQTGEVSIGQSLIAAVNTFAGSINTTFANIQQTINTWIAWIKDHLPAFMTSGLDYLDLPQISLLNTSSYDQDSPYPHGATGLVAAPNAPFMAILGDQKRGTNVEAPLATIEQAVENALSRRGYNESSGGMIRNIIKLDGQVLYDAVKKIDKRVGSSLATKAGAA